MNSIVEKYFKLVYLIFLINTKKENFNIITFFDSNNYNKKRKTQLNSITYFK